MDLAKRVVTDATQLAEQADQELREDRPVPGNVGDYQADDRLAEKANDQPTEQADDQPAEQADNQPAEQADDQAA